MPETYFLPRRRYFPRPKDGFLRDYCPAYTVQPLRPRSLVSYRARSACSKRFSSVPSVKAALSLRYRLRIRSEGAPVQKPRQGVVLGLTLHEHFPLPIFFVDAVVGPSQGLNLPHPLDGLHRPVADAHRIFS